ncbi:DNA internalization-related competence protein ComEC/Rec2 [Cognatiluteimonas lumbrici]|uniref:DNA internalization-related competence protein ComEC/Rec2 n=1 Tax=Cognatiluteimonas lumbrici TaxID=2559601 RepID=UPI00112874F7|nr:DNA internalization-related competence protein ComEC/Rec2 [Luteimonas lumbrici]
MPSAPPPAPFGPAAAAALVSGVAACLQLPSLPGAWLFAALLPAGLLAWAMRRRGRLLGPLLCGVALAGLHAGYVLGARLPAALEGRELEVAGTVLELPRRDAARVRFRFRVDDAPSGTEALRGKLLQLSWYFDGDDRVSLAPGERWRLRLKLRAPHALRNPGTRDGERRALAERIAATGYVRDPGLARRLSPARGIDAWRDRMGERIAATVDAGASRFVRALALGDTRALDTADWQVLRAAGLTHLIAISGFHVGLVAGFFALLAKGLWRCLPRLGRWLPRPQAAALGALLGALGYAAVAGFALPTLRTALMVAVLVLARLLRRAQRTVDALALAAIVLLLADPLAALTAGFWLSFAGVAWLLWCLPATPPRSLGGVVRGFVDAQAVATIGLLPVAVALFGQASAAGPLANLVAIPWWSLVVVPLSLLGTALEAVHAGAGAWCWRLAAACFELSWPLFDWLAGTPLALFWLPRPAWFALPFALAGGFWLLLPRGVPGKPLALLLWLPLLWPQRGLPPPGHAELWVLDVGQGLSVLVRTSGHALLYDMGAARAGGFDAGADVVVPALHALGVRRLDAAVVSHGDNDHAGGFAGVARAFPPGIVLAPPGMPSPVMPPTTGHRHCVAGMHWTWDGVEFRFLHPARHFPYLDNESSCVLRVEAGGRVALLPGDIGEVVEGMLLRAQGLALRTDVVLVPHHGSGSGSAPGFVAATGARWALVSAGYRNRFGHPKPEVVARWRGQGAAVVATFDSGAQRVLLGRGGVRLEGERDVHRRLWDAVAASAAPTR